MKMVLIKIRSLQLSFYAFYFALLRPYKFWCMSVVMEFVVLSSRLSALNYRSVVFTSVDQ